MFSKFIRLSAGNKSHSKQEKAKNFFSNNILLENKKTYVLGKNQNTVKIV